MNLSTILNDNFNKVAEAFEDWEYEFRSSPEDFLTQEECSRMEISSLSQQCAIAFIAYVRQREE